MPNVIYEKDNYQIHDHGTYLTLKGTPDPHTYSYGKTPNRTPLYVYLMILGSATTLILIHPYAAVAALILLHLYHLPKYYTTKQTPKRQALDEALNQLEHHHQSEQDFQNYLKAVADTTNAQLPNIEDHTYELEFYLARKNLTFDYNRKCVSTKLSGQDLYLDTDGKVKNKYPITITTPPLDDNGPWEIHRVKLLHEGNALVTFDPNSEEDVLEENTNYFFPPGTFEFNLSKYNNVFRITTRPL